MKRARGPPSLGLEKRGPRLGFVSVEKRELLKAREREKNLMVPPPRAFMRENAVEHGAGSRKVADAEKEVDAVSERRKILLLVSARGIKGQRGLELPGRHVEPAAVERRVSDVVGRVGALQRTSGQGLGTTEERDRLVGAAEIVREIARRARHFPREALVLDTWKQRLRLDESGARCSIFGRAFVKLRAEQLREEPERDGGPRETRESALEDAPGLAVTPGFDEDPGARDVLLGRASRAEDESAFLLPQADERPGRREPLVERAAGDRLGGDAPRHGARAFRAARPLKDANRDKRPPQIGLRQGRSKEKFRREGGVGVRDGCVEDAAGRGKVACVRARERRDRESRRREVRESGFREAGHRVPASRSRHARGDLPAFLVVPKRVRVCVARYDDSCFRGLRESLLRNSNGNVSGRGGLRGPEAACEESGRLEHRTRTARRGRPRPRGTEAPLRGIEPRRELVRDVEEAARIRRPGRVFRLAPPVYGVMEGREGKPENRCRVAAAHPEGDERRLLPGTQARGTRGKEPKPESGKLFLERTARKRIPPVESNCDESDWRSVQGAGRPRPIRERLEESRAGIPGERAREPAERTALLEGRERSAFQERGRLVPARGSAREPESGGPDCHGRPGWMSGRDRHGRKREAEQIARHGSSHGAPARELRDERLRARARVRGAERGKDVFRDVARQGAIEGALDRTAQRVHVVALDSPSGESQGRAGDRERGRHGAPRGGRGRAQRRPVRITLARAEKRDVFRGDAEAVKRQKSRERTEPHEVCPAGSSVELVERHGARALEAEDEAMWTRARRDKGGQERMRKPHERRTARREIAARNRPLSERLRRHFRPSAERVSASCPGPNDFGNRSRRQVSVRRAETSSKPWRNPRPTSTTVAPVRPAAANSRAISAPSQVATPPPRVMPRPTARSSCAVSSRLFQRGPPPLVKATKSPPGVSERAARARNSGLSGGGTR